MNKISIHSSHNYNFSDYWKILFKNRHLLFALSTREIKIKYVQSKLGVLWSIIQSMTAILIYSSFFKFIFKFDFQEYPYYLYVFSGTVSWTIFSYLLNQGSFALIHNQELIQKLNFPKLFLLGSKIIVTLAEILPSLIILLVLTTSAGLVKFQNIIWLPIIIILNFIIAIIPPLWISVLSVKKRDVLHIVPYLANFGIWLTPIFWIPKNSPEIVQILANFNPLTWVLSLYRWALFDSPIDINSSLSYLVFVLILLPTGIYHFIIQEKKIIDYL